jgi:hypothetical protein
MLLGSVILFFCGCEKSNNHLTLKDLVDHLVRCGVKVQQVQPVRAELLKADRAVAVNIDGQEVGIYKYDTNVEKRRVKIRKVEDDGFIYVVGLKYPVIVKGSFLLIGVHCNPQKHQILKALKSFK